MANGDIRGFLAKKGGMESVGNNTEVGLGKNKSISTNAEEIDGAVVEVGCKRDVFTATSGRKSAVRGSGKGECCVENESNEKSDRGRGSKKKKTLDFDGMGEDDE